MADLFVTDLDGTLLNAKSLVSKESQSLLKPLIEQGVQFTIATARTHATAVELLDGLELKLPIIVMNGVGLYQMSTREYEEIIGISDETLTTCLSLIKKAQVQPLVYRIEENELFVFYETIVNAPTDDFYQSRKNKTLKKFIRVEAIELCLGRGEAVNMLAFDRTDILLPLVEKLQQLEDITVTCYELEQFEGYSYFELYSRKASKANGIKSLCRHVSYDHLVVFGDNLNDVPMFLEADEAYATQNAVASLKEIATDVIGHHDEEAVARYLAKRLK